MAITYANDIHTDGAGAQIQRILGTIALAEALGAPYVHSPITKLDYHGWDLYLNNEVDPDLPQKWENFLGIPCKKAITSCKARVWNNVRVDDLPDLARWIHEDGLARILLPYPFLDVFPHYLEQIRPNLHDWYDATPKPEIKKTSSFQVALHVRRGELHLWESHRMLPNSYYLNIIRELKRFVPSDTEFHIHSEGSLSAEKGSEEIANAERFSQYMKEKSKVVQKDRDHFEDFMAENCILHINEDIFQTFHRCVTSDIFVMSKGSLSYVMGAYAKGMVLYQPFWHNPLPSWFVMPQWRTIGSVKDILINGSKILKDSIFPDKKKWTAVRLACTLKTAQMKISGLA